MKKVGLRKYTIFLLVCFFSLIFTVSAKPITIPYGSTYSIGVGYVGFKCDASTLDYFNLQSNGDGTYSLEQNRIADTDGSESLYCSYDYQKGAADQNFGEITYTINYFAGETKNLEVYLNVDAPSENIMTLLGASKIVSYSQMEDGNEYLDVKCSAGSTSCTAEMSLAAKDLAGDPQNLISIVEFTYIPNGSTSNSKAIVKFNMNVFQGAYAWVNHTDKNSIAQCSFGGSWKTGNDVKSNGHTVYYYSTSNLNDKLPDCTANPKAARPVKYKGWMEVSGDYVYAVYDSCSTAKPANQITLGANKHYAPCFEYEPSVQLYIQAGTLDPSSGWTSTDGGNTFVSTSSSSSSTITLPNVTFTGFSSDYTFEYWMEKETGNKYNPGDTVSYNNHTYIAVISTTTSYGNEFKVVKKDKVFFLSTPGLASCRVDSTGSSYVSAVMQNGDCAITGNEITGSGIYADVLVTLEDNAVKTYKFSVIEDTTSGGEFIIDLTPPTGGGDGGAESFDSEEPLHIDPTTGAATDECTMFRITSSGTSGNIGTSKVTGNKRLTSTLYSVTPQCDSDENDYVALCLDPGRLGPSNHLYERGTDLEGDHPMSKLADYYAANLDIDRFNEAHYDVRIAAHVAARIVGVANGFDARTNEDEHYKYLYAPYGVLGDYLKSNPTPTYDEMYAKLGEVINFSVNGTPSVQDLVAKYISEALSAPDQEESADEYYGFEITNATSGDTQAYGSSGYTVTYRGTITAPEGVTSFQLKVSDKQLQNGPSFGVTFAGGSSTCDNGGGSGGRVSCDYEVTITAPKTADVKIPTDAQKPLLSYIIEYTGGEMVNSIFIAQPVDSPHNLQRMLMFNLDQPSILVYFDILPNSCDMPGMDYTVCADPASSACQNDFASKLFVAAGCCQEIEDEETYSYVVNNICGGECTTSTLPQICSYDINNLGQSDLYEIRDGAFLNGSSLNDNISECVVNTKDLYENDAAVDANFDRFDDAGNQLNVTEFEDNQYCEVTCKEDWQITMDSFGNYAGDKAVAAGHYFQIVNNDIFMGAKRTCYTSYVDYENYANDLVQDGKQFVNLYNDYSNKSHAYSDYEKQKFGDGTMNFTWSSVTTYDRSGTCNSYEIEELVCTGEGEDEDCDWVGTGEYDQTCSQSSETAVTDYWSYQLNIQSTNSEFEDAEAGKGKYIKFYVEEDTEVEHSSRNAANGDYTELLIKDGEDGQKPTLYTDPGLSKPNSLDVCFQGEDDMCGAPDGGSCSWSCSDTGDGFRETRAGTDATSTHQSAFNEMKDERMNTLQSEMNSLNSSMSALRTTMDERVKDMYDCQHFQLENTSDGTSGTFYSDGPSYDYRHHATTQSLSGTLYYNGGGKDTVKIKTMFQPYVDYKYGEDAYMSILISNKENYLEQFDSKNDKEFGGSWAGATNEKKEIQIKVGGGTEKVNLARNYMDFNYYAISYGEPTTDENGNDTYSNLWKPDSDVGRKYGADGTAEGANLPKTGAFGLSQGDQGSEDDSGRDGERLYKLITVCSVNKVYSPEANAGQSDSEGILQAVTTGPTWEGGSCYEFKAPYIAANYISASIENSSFYRNQGSWYASVEDLKEHGEGLDAAIQNAIDHRGNMYKYNKDKELKSGNWSPIGLYNVFPISITTPRNLYTYTYEFYDIGSYYDGDLGRIMGGENHDTTKAIIEENSRTCFYEVFEELCLCCGDKINTYVYDDNFTKAMIDQFVQTSGINYKQSDLNVIEKNRGGTLSVATSSVNLSDISSTSGRDIASNWSDNSAFTYGGDTTLSTGKGAELMTYIESQGESIYSKTSTDNGPEYAYYLTPTTLSSIRDYNQQFGYGINYNQLIGYGRYSIATQDGGATEESFKEKNDGDFNDKIINFQHYGSQFLEDLNQMNGVVVDGTLATPGNSNVCFVTEGNVSTIKSKMSGSNPCRWIDYIEYVDSGYTYPADSDAGSGTVYYFRLAFK